jgi:DMSO/TMAO reductase YedYZ molybdopterin-dependent catalytic subunit
MSIEIPRRKILRAGLASVAGASGLAAAAKIADRYGLLAPDHGGIFGAGEVLTYGAQRLLMFHHSMAREFNRAQISKVTRINHRYPDDDDSLRLLKGDFADWRLRVDGLVSHPTFFSLDEIKRMPLRSQITMLACEEGWSYIAEWTGVSLSYLMNLVGADPKAKWVVFYPLDDFWGSIDMAEALHPQTLLAYRMNGEDLTDLIPAYGAPLRLRIPRQLGYKNLKYLVRISVVESLRIVGDGNGSAAPDIGYSWYAGI